MQTTAAPVGAAVLFDLRCRLSGVHQKDGHTIHPHPTLSETVNFAAEMSEGTITDLMPPKRKWDR
jgi:hypothetical protein